MGKTLKFNEYLQQLMRVREKLILHDLSNKFNLLSLALEDLEELSEDASMSVVSKEDLVNEIKTIRKARSKFLDLTNGLKSQISDDSSKIEFIDVFAIARDCHQKELSKNSISISINKEVSPDLTSYRGCFFLVSSTILLRALLLSDVSINLNLVDKDTFLREEETFLNEARDQLSEEFKGSYLSILSGFWDQAAS